MDSDVRASISRRAAMKMLGLAGVAAASPTVWPAFGQEPVPGERSLPGFTGPGANPYWNSVGPIVTYPQKDPLVLLTDRPVQLETPRQYFLSDFTPNSAFYVRWHLDEIPNDVDLSQWRLSIEGNVNKPQKFSFSDLLTRFKPVSIAAVNQCSGNSRSFFQPRVPGGQWGHGAMGNAQWTGVHLKDLLAAAGVKTGSVAVQFQGLEQGKGPEGKGAHFFLKSLDLSNPILDQTIVAYSMNDAPLPFLNGFPVRLIVPGYFATYWMKGLSWIRVLDKPDDNFWMKTGYRIPDTPNGSTTPEDVKAGKVKTIPINVMPVRSLIITPDGSVKIPEKTPTLVRGIAFSGHGGITKVDFSADGGKTWKPAQLGEDHGAYSFRSWKFSWKSERPGSYLLAARATDAKGNTQSETPVWNPGGYLWNTIERQEVTAGAIA
jgi:DMSO/TMAO reductase YedYZ molybdopterin-dependent catalytic subunit